MNLVISDPKTGKGHTKKVEEIGLFLNKKIGETIKLDSINLAGYEAKITGGSDKQGFPMKADLSGTMRKKVFITSDKKKGIRKRTSVRGNTVSTETSQLNLVVTKHGEKKLDTIVEKVEKAKEKTEKEKVMEDSGMKQHLKK